MDTGLLDTLWPLFADEALGHVAAIGQGLEQAERAEPGAVRGVLEEVRRAAHSLKGSAASLGLSGYELAAHAVEDVLATCRDRATLPPGALPPVLAALAGLEQALRAQEREPVALAAVLQGLAEAVGQAGGPAPPPTVDAGFHARALLQAESLELVVGNLSSPTADRPALVAEARALAAALAQGAAHAGVPSVQALAEALDAPLAATLGSRPDAARGVATAAGLALDLGQALQALAGGPPASPATVALPSSPSGLGAAEGELPRSSAGRALRVAEGLVEQLGVGLEALARGRARTEQGARGVAAHLRTGGDLEARLERWVEAAHLATPGPREREAAALAQAFREFLAQGRERADAVVRDVERQQVPAASARVALDALRLEDAAWVLEPLRRTAREVAGRLGKEVDVQVHGGEVRVDRHVLDGLRDALVHLVRNAVDHGLESASERARRGKPARGLLRLAVERRGGRALLSVADDGAGLDLARVRQVAVERGLIAAEEAQRLSDAAAIRLLFRPGFSTASSVSSTSGRGVGLDAVQEAVRRLLGSVDVTFTPGGGTRFVLDVPLHLAATLSLLVRTGPDLAELPAERVEQVVRLRAHEVAAAQGYGLARLGGRTWPFVLLDRVWGAHQGRLPGAQGDSITGLVLQVGAERVVLGVDEVLAHHEVVVQPLPQRFFETSHLAGATQLDDGRVVAVLDVDEVLRRAAALPPPALVGPPGKVRLLVCDDSLTTRAMMRGLLERGGFEVVVAADGEEAFEVLLHSDARLVVSDVQMPRLDGLELARRMRDDPRVAHVPLVLVTSLDEPENRLAGLTAGANAYLVKREVAGGRLLELVRGLLGS